MIIFSFTKLDLYVFKSVQLINKLAFCAYFLYHILEQFHHIGQQQVELHFQDENQGTLLQLHNYMHTPDELYFSRNRGRLIPFFILRSHNFLAQQQINRNIEGSKQDKLHVFFFIFRLRISK